MACSLLVLRRIILYQMSRWSRREGGVGKEGEGGGVKKGRGRRIGRVGGG